MRQAHADLCFCVTLCSAPAPEPIDLEKSTPWVLADEDLESLSVVPNDITLNQLAELDLPSPVSATSHLFPSTIVLSPLAPTILTAHQLRNIPAPTPQDLKALLRLGIRKEYERGMRSIKVEGGLLPLDILRVWNALERGRRIAQAWRDGRAVLRGDCRIELDGEGLFVRERSEREAAMLAELAELAERCLEELKWDGQMDCFASSPTTEDILKILGMSERRVLSVSRDVF